MREIRETIDSIPKTNDHISNWYEGLPAIQEIDKSPGNKESLIEASNKHLEINEHLRNTAEKLGHDIVAFSTEHGKVLVIGAGVTTLALGAISFIIYQRIHRHSDGKEE